MEGECWGKVISVILLSGGEQDKEYVGKQGKVKIEDVVIYYFQGMKKPKKSDLIAQVYIEGDVINVRTLGNYYQFKTI